MKGVNPFWKVAVVLLAVTLLAMALPLGTFDS